MFVVSSGKRMLHGFIEANPTIAGLLIGAVAVAAVAFLVQRFRSRHRGGA